VDLDGATVIRVGKEAVGCDRGKSEEHDAGPEL